MKTKKNDFLLTMADLDEQLIKKADPYNDSKTVKAKPGVFRTRALVIVSATALAALLFALKVHRMIRISKQEE